MAKNNVKLGYCYSVALHVLVAIAMFAYALIDLLFPKEVIENKLVFEMVEPTQTKEVLPPPPPQQQEEIKAEKIEKIEPIDVPEPEPEPEPEPKVEPTPKPTETPTPKKIEKPKKVSIEQFRQKNPKKKTTQKKTKARQVKIDTIKSTHSSIDSISDISPRTSSNSAAMQDALSAYTAEIKFKTQRNWKIPENSAGLSARVAFRVSKTGIISGIRIVESSGDKDFDATIVEALRSITVSAPPDNSSHNVSIRFDAS